MQFTSDISQNKDRLIRELRDDNALLRSACKMLVDSYMPEAGTYALGELYRAREAARAALADTERQPVTGEGQP